MTSDDTRFCMQTAPDLRISSLVLMKTQIPAVVNEPSWSNYCQNTKQCELRIFTTSVRRLYSVLHNLFIDSICHFITYKHRQTWTMNHYVCSYLLTMDQYGGQDHQQSCKCFRPEVHVICSHNLSSRDNTNVSQDLTIEDNT